MKGIGLNDIVDIQVLQEIQDSYSKVTKIAMVIVDFKGEPITDYSNFTRFCKAFRSEGKCRDMCYRSDAHGGIESARSGKPYIYTCHTGLVDFAIPIVVEGQFLGSILAGQVKIEDDHDFAPIMSKVPDFVAEQMATPELKAYYEEIPNIKSEELIAAINLMYIMSTHIVEKGFAQLMQQELNEKNDRLIEEMKVRMALEKNLKESELQLLKSQVNPHFLFNVLNTINSLAMIEKAPKTSEMIYFLSEMLRYTIKHGTNQIVPIEQELDYTMKYLKIQQIRMGDKLKFSIDVPDRFLSIKIPFMIVQSMVSNAITHGLFQNDKEGLIQIRGYDDADYVYMTVSDNGTGMDKEKIAEILKGTYKADGSKNTTGIGLINADKRLVHLFGEKHRLQIESVPGKGTKVSIKLPKY